MLGNIRTWNFTLKCILVTYSQRLWAVCVFVNILSHQKRDCVIFCQDVNCFIKFLSDFNTIYSILYLLVKITVVSQRSVFQKSTFLITCSEVFREELYFDGFSGKRENMNLFSFESSALKWTLGWIKELKFHKILPLLLILSKLVSKQSGLQHQDENSSGNRTWITVKIPETVWEQQ